LIVETADWQWLNFVTVSVPAYSMELDNFRLSLTEAVVDIQQATPDARLLWHVLPAIVVRE
jgi:hypothetical protein